VNGNIGSTTKLGSLTINQGTIFLGGNIFTTSFAGGTGNITLDQASGLILTTNATISTATTSANSGSIRLPTLSAGATGLTLQLSTESGDASHMTTSAGNIALGTVANAGGNFL